MQPKISGLKETPSVTSGSHDHLKHFGVKYAKFSEVTNPVIRFMSILFMR